MQPWTENEIAALETGTAKGWSVKRIWEEYFDYRSYESVRQKAARLRDHLMRVSPLQFAYSVSDLVPPTSKTEHGGTEVRAIVDQPIRTIEELVRVLGIDEDAWAVAQYWVKTQQTKDGTRYHISANLKPLVLTERQKVVEQIWDSLIDDAVRHAPPYKTPEWRPRDVLTNLTNGQSCMAEIAIVDPHIGMLSWGKECGVPYDTDIAVQNYEAAAAYLMGVIQSYPVERIVYIVGHDLFHADTLAEGGKGATTTKGTMQDIDTRLAKIFTAVRKAVVAGIDQARLLAPVDVICVAGNHDQQTVYKFGEVLNAWYRNDDAVDVQFGPSKRRYYRYGNTVFMHTHGEEFYRKRDNLVSVFATECPKEMWAAANFREVHVGHNHINMQKVYTGDPTEVEWEGRAVRVRSLPGLTPEDSWHHEEGYKHTRAATVLIFREQGGIAGLHEFTL